MHVQDNGPNHSLSPTTMELHNNPVSKCEEPCDKDSKLVSVISAYCMSPENNTLDMNASRVERTVMKTDDDKVRKSSKFKSVGDVRCQRSYKTITLAVEDNAGHVKMKVTNKTAKKHKCDEADKSVCALADITAQINVPFTKPRKNKTVSSCNSGEESYGEDSELVQVMSTYCTVSDCTMSENKTNGTWDVKGSRLKTAVKKTDDVEVRKASKFTAAEDSHCQSSYKTVAVTADGNVKDVKMKPAKKTAKKQKCDEADKPVGALADVADHINVPITKPRRNKSASSCSKKYTVSLAAEKADGKISDAEFKRKKIKQEGTSRSSSCDVMTRRSRKMTDTGALGAAACIPVSNVDASEDAKKATEEHSVASCSNFHVTTSSRQTTSSFAAGGALCKHDIAASCSNFDMTLRSNRTRNRSMVCKKDSCTVDCSQQKKDSVETVKKTSKQYIRPCSNFDITLQTHRTNHHASGDACGDKVNCNEVQNGSLQTAQDVVTECKDTRMCSNLDMTAQSHGKTNLSHDPDGIRIAYKDTAMSFHMTLRQQPQCQYHKGTERKRSASVLVSKKLCSTKSDDEHKLQKPQWTKGQKLHRCSNN